MVVVVVGGMYVLMYIRRETPFGDRGRRLIGGVIGSWSCVWSMGDGRWWWWVVGGGTCTWVVDVWWHLYLAGWSIFFVRVVYVTLSIASGQDTML